MRKRAERTLATMALAGTCFMGFVPMAMAEEVEAAKPEAELAVDVLSQYVWRGYALSDDNIVIQPSMTVSHKGFAFNLWANLDTDNDAADGNNWNETDMTISYDWSMSGVDFGVGYIYYALEDGADDTQEFYAAISKGFEFVTPSFTVYKDTDAAPGWYMNLALESSIPVNEELAVDVGFSVGYLIVDELQVDGGDYSDFHDGVISVAMTFDVVEYVSVTPMLSYSFPLSSEADDLLEASNAGNGDEDILYGGVNVSFAF